MTSIRVSIRGKVQGVSFRKNAQIKARELGIRGWVRNSNDGSVSLEACAEREKLNKFIRWINVGSPFSIVEDVNVDWFEKEDCKQDDFEIII